MQTWAGALRNIADIDLALIVAVAVAAFVALVTRGRGGRFRGLIGWAGFWVGFAALLAALTYGRPLIALGLLGAAMFVTLRTWFFVAPVRQRDRYAILAAYLTVPLALYPGFMGSQSWFLATVPISLFLLFPVLLSFGPPQDGLLDSMGRVLLGVLLFVFCAAHLGLMVRPPSDGLLPLFGLLALAAELPQRLFGRFAHDPGGRLRPVLGIVLSLVLATGLGFWLGPRAGLVEEDAARAGFLVAVAVAMGAVLAGAAMRELGLGTTGARVGRGALLDRAIPAVYAAPVFFHYLNQFA